MLPSCAQKIPPGRLRGAKLGIDLTWKLRVYAYRRVDQQQFALSGHLSATRVGLRCSSDIGFRLFVDSVDSGLVIASVLS